MTVLDSTVTANHAFATSWGENGPPTTSTRVASAGGNTFAMSAIRSGRLSKGCSFTTNLRPLVFCTFVSRTRGPARGPPKDYTLRRQPTDPQQVVTFHLSLGKKEIG